MFMIEVAMDGVYFASIPYTPSITSQVPTTKFIVGNPYNNPII